MQAASRAERVANWHMHHARPSGVPRQAQRDAALDWRSPSQSAVAAALCQRTPEDDSDFAHNSRPARSSPSPRPSPSGRGRPLAPRWATSGAVRRTNADRSARGAPIVLPLPEGEGRGKGELAELSTRPRRIGRLTPRTIRRAPAGGPRGPESLRPARAAARRPVSGKSSGRSSSRTQDS